MMAHLATDLLRITTRAFYDPQYAIVIDALIHHWTLKDADLASLLGMQPKALRKLCGRLREDGLLSVQTRAERRTDQTYLAPNGKERYSSRDWYYLNFHRAIDSIKYRLHKLTKHMESLGLPTTEKKDLSCPRCKSQFTELEVMDHIDLASGDFLCHRCGHALDPMEEEERANENESMKRLNQQLDKVLSLLQQIDAATVPENDFDHALSKQVPLIRTDNNPGARVETMDLPGRNMQSTRGLEIKPEKISVQIQDDDDVKKENAAAEAEAKRAKEAKQNSLPVWITNSTVTHEITTAGHKEAEQRRLREAHTTAVKTEESEEKKPDVGDDGIMAAYWKAMKSEQEAKKAKEAEDEEADEEDEEDEFEDVDVSGGGNTPANGANGKAAVSTGMNTPMGESSNATDDERDAKRVRIAGPSTSAVVNGANGPKTTVDTPAASDEDEDELEFQDV